MPCSRRSRSASSSTRAARRSRSAARSGVQTVGFFMVGVPGDTPATIERTIDLARELEPDFAKFTVFVPYPGTTDYNNLKAQGKLRGRRAVEPLHELPDARQSTGLSARGNDRRRRDPHAPARVPPRLRAARRPCGAISCASGPFRRWTRCAASGRSTPPDAQSSRCASRSSNRPGSTGRSSTTTTTSWCRRRRRRWPRWRAPPATRW